MEIFYPDGNGGRKVITIGNASSSLPTMSESIKGGAKVGRNLYMTSESLNASLPTASNLIKGGVKIGYGLDMSGDTLVVTLQGGNNTDVLEEYGKVVTIPTITGGLPTIASEIEELEDWNVINTATYDSQASSGAWDGDIVVVLPEAFAQRSYTITHIHNEVDYSEIFPKDSIVYIDDETENGYDITALGESRYIIKIPATAVRWQNESPTRLVIHGLRGRNLCGSCCPCLVPGEGITIINNVISTKPASESVRGGVKIGAGFSMEGDVLNCTVQSGLDSIPIASESVIGGIKIGDGLEVENDGTLNCTVQGSGYDLPTMSESIKGGAKVGNSLIVTADEKLHVALGTTPLTIEGSMWIHDPSL